MLHPREYFGLVQHRVVQLRGRGLTAAVHLQPAAPDGPVGAVLLALDVLLQNPRIAVRDGQRTGEFGVLRRSLGGQPRQVQAPHRVVRDPLQDVAAPVGEVEVRHLLRIGDPPPVGHPQAQGASGFRERSLVIHHADHVFVGVHHLADAVEQSSGAGIVQARRRTRNRDEHVDALAPDDVEQRFGVSARSGLGHAVERVHRPGETVTGEAVLRRFDQNHPVPGDMEGPRQLQRLGHLAATDQHGPPVARSPGRIRHSTQERETYQSEIDRQGGEQSKQRCAGLSRIAATGVLHLRGRTGNRHGRNGGHVDRSGARRIRVTPSRRGNSTCSTRGS